MMIHIGKYGFDYNSLYTRPQTVLLFGYTTLLCFFLLKNHTIWMIGEWKIVFLLLYTNVVIGSFNDVIKVLIYL